MWLSVTSALDESTRNIQHKHITVFLYRIVKQRKSNISIVETSFEPAYSPHSTSVPGRDDVYVVRRRGRELHTIPLMMKYFGAEV